MPRGSSIGFNLETSPLELKTIVDAGIGDQVKIVLQLYDAEDSYAGGLFLSLGSAPQYSLDGCTELKELSKLRVDQRDKKLTVSKQRGPRIKIFCNDVKVLDVKMSDSTCSGDSDWNQIWSRDVVKIQFLYDDTASDYYRSFTGKYLQG